MKAKNEFNQKRIEFYFAKVLFSEKTGNNLSFKGFLRKTFIIICFLSELHQKVLDLID
jgi:hypothetical protein